MTHEQFCEHVADLAQGRDYAATTEDSVELGVSTTLYLAKVGRIELKRDNPEDVLGLLAVRLWTETEGDVI